MFAISFNAWAEPSTGRPLFANNPDADSSPAPSPTLTPSQASSPAAQDSIDPNFLLLPAYDIVLEKTASGVKVGDSLAAQLEAAGNGSSQVGQAQVGQVAGSLPKDTQIQIPPGTENADDLGFALSELSSQKDGQIRFSITPVKSGHVTLPSLELTDASGKAIARTNPISIEVTSAIATNDPKPKEAEPPRPPVSLGFPTATLIALAILALALIGAGVYWAVQWAKKRRLNAPSLPAEPPKPEDEVALLALANLEKMGLLRQGQFKAHYFTLSEILKHYVGNRYRFDAAESTTYEMISHLEQYKGLTKDKLDSLRDLFDRLDRVKFTDYRPLPIEGTELLEDAKKLVVATRRPPQIVTPGKTDASS
jgi:hypothetical protein